MFELGREMTRFEGEMWENELIDTTENVLQTFSEIQSHQFSI